MLIIPAIDLQNGKVVRLLKGNYKTTKVYSNNPLSYAIYFQEIGAKRLHIIDLDGAKRGAPVHKELIFSIIEKLKIPVQVGGGIRTEKDIEDYLQKGVSQVIIGTKAIENKTWLKEISFQYPKKIIVSIDLKGEYIAVSGWEKTIEINYLDFIKSLEEFPLFAIILTITEKDGTLEGIETERLEKALSISPHPLIIAGGIKDLKDLEVLNNYKNSGLLGVIIGKAIYEGTLDLKKAIHSFQNSK